MTASEEFLSKKTKSISNKYKSAFGICKETKRDPLCFKICGIFLIKQLYTIYIYRIITTEKYLCTSDDERVKQIIREKSHIFLV